LPGPSSPDGGLQGDPGSHAVLKAMAEKAKVASLVRAIAGRAQNLKNRSGVIKMLKDEKEARAEFEALWGKDVIAELMRAAPEKLEKESIALFEKVVAKHGTLKHPTHGTLGDFAKANILALR